MLSEIFRMASGRTYSSESPPDIPKDDDICQRVSLPGVLPIPNLSGVSAMCHCVLEDSFPDLKHKISIVGENSNIGFNPVQEDLTQVRQRRLQVLSFMRRAHLLGDRLEEIFMRQTASGDDDRFALLNDIP